jgi:hypothetical protein
MIHTLGAFKHKDSSKDPGAILATWEAEIWRIMVRGQPGQIVCETLISIITRAKWTRGVAQAVKYLLCKLEALSSNPSPSKKERCVKLIKKGKLYNNVTKE